ncbi:uncharacterized protein DFL_003511 [Arthrobotrys flagrans]|uniref:Mediator of RNA polymerase II transcription subunit 4 n=1 Tax=Arthrobotrys flagrans TaxID=97331 RepID=A0A437A271_ARTFL|nr:hypothetical protein DFL_003511 [Arthrobotrys flagrans]
MDAVLKKSLDAIESSLASLLDSVTVDDPSSDAAAALVAADDDLSSSLEQLVTHQTNYQRLLHLRALSSALDSELSTLLTTLSQARTELQSTTTTVFPSHSRQVEYEALLSYATKISKFTRPPTHLKSSPQAEPTTTAEASSTALVLKSADVNGNNVPKDDGAEGSGVNNTAGTGAGETTGNAATRPTAEDIAMLDPTAGMPFVPWPTEDIMRRGILANMGSMETMPDATAGKETDQGTTEGDATVQAAAPSGGSRQMSDADRERAREEAARREAERKQKEQEVFQGLDLYDPDSD